MKRFICLICLLALLLSACSADAPIPTVSEESYTHGVYQLTFETRLLSNDGVGNDWTFAYTCNGQPAQSKHQITYPLGVFSFFTIGVEVREKDKLDDVETACFQVGLCDGSSSKTQVTVTESSGRYKGHTAIWEVACKVELIDKYNEPAAQMGSWLVF